MGSRGANARVRARTRSGGGVGRMERLHAEARPTFTISPLRRPQPTHRCCSSRTQLYHLSPHPIHPPPRSQVDLKDKWRNMGKGAELQARI